jgi:hypothetical protein
VTGTMLNIPPENFATFRYMGKTLKISKFHSYRKQEEIKFGECLLSLSSEYFISSPDILKIRIK